ncbi:MAG: hypothetical protein NT091_03530 [Candidatus Falkowbacteria bacterium]|nr:hypothetical protein [Candidatus Falkowbacteria bacterium]
MGYYNEDGTYIIESKVFNIKIGWASSFIESARNAMPQLNDDNLIVEFGRCGGYIVVDFPNDKKVIVHNGIKLRKIGIPAIGSFKGKPVDICKKTL